MTLNYARELQSGIGAVRAAAQICQRLQQKLTATDTLHKKDQSPVTVADFASQAVICAHLQQALPGDAVVGEENAAPLRSVKQRALRASVFQQVRSVMADASDEDTVLQWIDRGSADASTARYWTLDPIDGTKGFLRGGQYAIALALIENGEVVLGILGCPNLSVGAQQGALFTAVKGDTATVASLFEAHSPATPIQVSQAKSARDALLCESVEPEHSNLEESARVAELLGIVKAPYRIDSQCKYAAVARNDASIYLRLPARESYRENIWDHAAGKIIVEAAGGIVTDIHGKTLDFSCGRHLDNNKGVLATAAAIHGQVIEAIRQARTQTSTYGV